MSKNDEQKERESEKGLVNTNKQKTNTRTYVNQREQGIKQLLNIP
jgi:hypothetical protein